MTLLHMVVVALVQGFTEFLPVSSSGHLVLVPVLTGWPDQGLGIDIAVHVGSLGAVLFYFRRDIGALIAGLIKAVLMRPDAGSRLLALLLIASVPVMLAGAAVATLVPTLFRNIEVIAWTTTIGGLLLYFADRFALRINRLEHMAVAQALIIGLAQVLALVPGTSRAGITITAARMCGFERREAARFSMLLSIPAIVGAGVLGFVRIAERGDPLLAESALISGGLAFVAAFAAIALLMSWLRHASYAPLVVYRLLVGGGLLWWVYFSAAPA